MRKNDRGPGYVQSIERAFSIIEMLKLHRELSISELGSLLSLDRSTVHRLLATLRHLGYANQDKTTLKYSNSLKFFDIGNSVLRSLGLTEAARPFMKELARETGEGVNLAVLESYCVIYIDKIESQATFQINLPLGNYMPAYCTGLGKMLLSGLPEEEIRRVFQDCDEPGVRGRTFDHLKIRRYTANTPPNVDALCAMLARIREQGYSMDDEEYIEGLFCVAVPVRNHSGSVVAAMSVALPRIVGVDIQEKRQEILKKLLVASQKVSSVLGCPA